MADVGSASDGNHRASRCRVGRGAYGRESLLSSPVFRSTMRTRKSTVVEGSFLPRPETARVRLLVCDTRTGMIGSVDLPYPARVISASAAQPAKSAGEAD